MTYLKADDIKWELANTQQITFEITERCNFNCYYCGYGHFYEDSEKRFDRDICPKDAFAFLNYMKALWKSNYSDSSQREICISFYGGEPLLNMPFIRSMIKFVDENLQNCGRVFRYSMTTNAYLLDKYIDFLIEHKFNLLISLDGDEKSDSYRTLKNGEETYEKVMHNIRYVRMKYPNYYDSDINFNAVLHDRNSFESIQRFFKTTLQKSPTIGELNTNGVRKENSKTFSSIWRSLGGSYYNSKDYQKYEKELKFNSPSYKAAALYLMHYSPYKFENYNELLYGKHESMIPTGTCLPFSKKVFITVSGKILPCERIGYKYALGEIHDGTVSLDFENIADKYNNYYTRVKEECSKCMNCRGCMQCLFFINNIENESLPIKCDSSMSEQDFAIYRNEQCDFFKRNPGCYYEIMKNFKLR